jgi:hypothetical protein
LCIIYYVSLGGLRGRSPLIKRKKEKRKKKKRERQAKANGRRKSGVLIAPASLKKECVSARGTHSPKAKGQAGKQRKGQQVSKRGWRKKSLVGV